MKKKYIEPEIILQALKGYEALMQDSILLPVFTGDKNDEEDDDEVDDLDKLLSNFGSHLWEE